MKLPVALRRNSWLAKRPARSPEGMKELVENLSCHISAFKQCLLHFLLHLPTLFLTQPLFSFVFLYLSSSVSFLPISAFPLFPFGASFCFVQFILFLSFSVLIFSLFISICNHFFSHNWLLNLQTDVWSWRFRRNDVYPKISHQWLHVPLWDSVNLIWSSLLNLLNTKRRPLYLKTQFVPRSKHFSSRL